MYWIRASGKANQLDQARLEARRKMRQQVATIAISAAVLVVMAVLRTNHGSHPPTSSLSTSIKAVRDATLHPDSFLAHMVNSTGPLDPIKLFHLSVQAAKKGLSEASERFEGGVGIYESISKMSLAALSDCKQLIGLAAGHLDRCILLTNHSSDETIEDIKTWLSAAITYQHTCIDGFANATSELRNMVAESLNNSTQFMSHSLTIVVSRSANHGAGGSVKLRRRLRSTHSDSSPTWLSWSDRRLLESSDHRKFAHAVVAKDGSGKYKTIREALSAAPVKDHNRFVIYVKKGIYLENVRVDDDKWNVMMVGDGMDATIVSGGLNFVDGTPTYSTSTFAVLGKGFVAQDMGFRNTAGAAKQQAVALMSASDRSVFHRCKFDAYQDTLLAHALRQFYRGCHIYGTVDFIFGNAAAVFQGCTILPRVPMRGQRNTITAQGKVDRNQNTGISIHHCTIRPLGDLSGVKVYLGRPWKPYSTTVFMRTEMEGIIDPAGWLPWEGDSAAPDTIFYSEYENFGPGSGTKDRVKWKGLRRMNSQQAARFTVGGFIVGNSWIPKTDIPFDSGM